MRHRKTTAILKREKAPREALLKSLARSVLIHESIKTTSAKAKAVKPFVERLITVGKRKDRNALRVLGAQIGDPSVAEKLTTELAERFANREGGYTRIRQIGFREGDGSKMVMLSLVEKTNAKK